jgi:hypothetical protein
MFPGRAHDEECGDSHRDWDEYQCHIWECETPDGASGNNKQGERVCRCGLLPLPDEEIPHQTKSKAAQPIRPEPIVFEDTAEYAERAKTTMGLEERNSHGKQKRQAPCEHIQTSKTHCFEASCFFHAVQRKVNVRTDAMAGIMRPNQLTINVRRASHVALPDKRPVTQHGAGFLPSLTIPSNLMAMFFPMQHRTFPHRSSSPASY